MAIVKMNKFTLLFFESQKDKLLETLQNFEGVQFINLQNTELIEKYEILKGLKKEQIDSDYGKYEESISKIKFCIEMLQKYVPEKSGITSLLEDKPSLSYKELNLAMEENKWEEVYLTLKEKDKILNNLSNEKTRLESEIESLKHWIKYDAPLNAVKSFKTTTSYIGTISSQFEAEFTKNFNTEIQNGYLEIIDRDSDAIYIFALVHNGERDIALELLKKYGFSAFQAVRDASPQQIIDNCKNGVEEILDKEKHIKEDILSYEGSRESLRVAFEYYNSLILRAQASNNFLRTENVIAVCGWNTIESNSKLEAIIKDTLGEDCYLSFSDVQEEEIEEVPIKLKNKDFAASFENVVEMYSMPLYNEVDPTPILSWFYVLFYGMMLSDAGYGLIMVGVFSFLIYKTKDVEKKKNYRLFFYAGISTVIWGAIYGGWFGDLLPKYLGINVPVLLDATRDITDIFILSLGFGVVHIFVGLGIKAYILLKTHQYKDILYDVVTWYSTLIGALFMLLGIGGSLGTVLFTGGIVGLLLTQGRSAPTIGGKIGWGIYGVYGITGYLGDIISYSRLLALGLATGFIANALNLIISLIPSPFKYILAPFLFLGLHIFNLLINALGSYVHAARLQYLEFFSKFYSGGGKKFTPFKHSDKYIKIIK